MSFKINFKNIRTVFIFITIVSIVVCIVVNFNLKIADELLVSIESLLSEITDQNKASFVSIIDDKVASLEIMANLISNENGSVLRNPNFSRIFVDVANSVGFKIIDVMDELPENIESQSLLKRRSTYIYEEISGDDRDIVFFTPYYRNETIKGVLVSYMDTEILSSLFVSAFGNRTDVTVIDSNGNVIVKSLSVDSGFLTQRDNLFDELEDAQVLRYDSIQTIRDNLSSGIKGSSYLKHGEQNKLIYYEPLGIADWHIALIVRENFMKGVVTAIVYRVILLTVTTVVLFTGFLIYIYFSRKVYSKELKKAIMKSETDAMTGLYNRRAFDKYLYSLYEQHYEKQSPFSVIMLDIDYFKPYNDNYGHQNGDDAIKKVSSILKSTIRSNSDLAFRYGGEEMVVILPNTDIYGACIVAEKIQTRIMAARIPHRYSKVSTILTVSQGVFGSVPVESGRDAADSFVGYADKALYKAKEGGRNNFVKFE